MFSTEPEIHYPTPLRKYVYLSFCLKRTLFGTCLVQEYIPVPRVWVRAFFLRKGSQDQRKTGKLTSAQSTQNFRKNDLNLNIFFNDLVSVSSGMCIMLVIFPLLIILLLKFGFEKTILILIRNQLNPL